MKKKHRLALAKLPGFVSESGALKLRVDAAERIGHDFDRIEELAYPPNAASAHADVLGKLAESQNQMLQMLKPMVDGILNDPTDPRSKMMQQLLGTLGGMPAMQDVNAIRSQVTSDDSSASPPVRDSGIDVQIDDDAATPIESATWLANNFERLIPGFVEAAKYAYSRLAEDPLSEAEAAAYIVDHPTEQDYLNRIRIESVEISPDRRYVFSLETPCGHLIEHGMYAVFDAEQLIACGEYDMIEELYEFGDDDDDDETHQE